METFWTVGIGVSLGLVTLSLVVLVALARELGVVLIRLGPDTARPTAAGLDIGTTVDPFEVTGLDGTTRQIGEPASIKHLLLFSSPTCPPCEDLMPLTKSFARSYRDEVALTILSSSPPNDIDQRWSDELSPHGILITAAPDLHLKMFIASTPYAMLLDESGRVAARGIVATLAHLESLLSVEQRIEHGHEPESARPAGRAPELEIPLLAVPATHERVPRLAGGDGHARDHAISVAEEGGSQ